MKKTKVVSNRLISKKRTPDTSSPTVSSLAMKAAQEYVKATGQNDWGSYPEIVQIPLSDVLNDLFGNKDDKTGTNSDVEMEHMEVNVTDQMLSGIALQNPDAEGRETDAEMHLNRIAPRENSELYSGEGTTQFQETDITEESEAIEIEEDSDDRSESEVSSEESDYVPGESSDDEAEGNGSIDAQASCRNEEGTAMRCLECGKGFADRNSFDGHVEQVHPMDSESDTAPKLNKQDDSEEDSIYECSFPGCGKVFKYEGNRKRHEDRIHRKLK